MTIEQALLDRSANACELCTASDDLRAHSVGPEDTAPAGHDAQAVLCQTCETAIANPSDHADHLRCVSDSMWSQVPAVQVTAWRVLSSLKGQTWAQDLLDMMYLDDAVKDWAEAGLTLTDPNAVITRDSNGAILADGDTVTVIKDLVVKGAGFTAKRGTSVRNISLTDNPEHIEGRVNGTRIVLVSAFLKKVV